MSLRQPQGQTRAQYGRDFGNFSSLDECPNASSYAGSADAVAMLEVGDRAYVIGSGPAHCTDAGSAGALDAVWALDAGTGLLFELDTTVTTGVAGTTEAQGESGPGGNPPAGTLTPTGNVAATWMASTPLIQFSANASFTGVLVRRILTGALPAEGYILDVGVGYLVSDPNAYGVIMLGYEQNAGTAFTGLGLNMRDGAANCDVLAVGDDGSGAPFTPTWVATGAGFTSTLNDWTKGPVRIVAEIRKLDGQTPTQWAIRVTTYSLFGNVMTTEFSQVSNPEAGFTTPVDLDGWAPNRIGVGFWNVGGAQACDMRLSHLRVYSLGSAVPA